MLEVGFCLPPPQTTIGGVQYNYKLYILSNHVLTIINNYIQIELSFKIAEYKSIYIYIPLAFVLAT
jgi:hypothetical protein